MTGLKKNILLLLLMIFSAGGAVVLRPTNKIAEQRPAIQLERIVPKYFGDWAEEEQIASLIVDPSQVEMINRIYNQTLSRVYKNNAGYRIMLSLAYGSDQSDGVQLHKPEVCYPAQGFVLHNKTQSSLSLPTGQIPITRINTSLGQRVEPVTYWMTIGNQVVSSNGIHKKIVEMGYGINGKIPDGMLIRFSSIDSDIQRAYKIQDQFASEMLAAIPSEHLERFSGKPR